MAAGMRVEGRNCTDPVLYDGIPELASVMCVHATMSQPPQLQNFTVKTQQLLQPIVLVTSCSSSYCSHNFTDATSYGCM